MTELRVMKPGFMKLTRVGIENREIEQSVSKLVKGTRGATGEVLVHAKRRQALLSARKFKERVPA